MIVIGKYKEIYNDDNLPTIFKNISDNEHKYKQKILNYLKSFEPSAVSPSRLRDVVSGDIIDIPLTFTEDDRYAWRSDIVYYFEKYNLTLPENFINDVMNKLA